MAASDTGAAARIGVVLHDFPAGGTERIVLRLANAWAAAGRQVTLFCGSEAGPARSEVGLGLHVCEASPPIVRGFTSRLRLGRALREMVASHAVDVLVGPGNFHLPVLAAAGSLPCATACKLSNPLVRPDQGAPVRRALAASTRRVADRIDMFVAMSTALADEAERVLRRRVETIAEPILESGRGNLDRRARGAPLLLCAGRMVPQKNFRLALRAFAELGRGDARLVLLGDGPQRAALERQTAALGIADRVSFVGRVPDIAPWLARADAFLLSSAYEGYPAVLVEAIAAGVPVVTTACSPAIPEILFDTSFGTAAAPMPEALAAALQAVLAGARVDDRARRALAERHDAARSAERWLACLDRAVAARTR